METLILDPLIPAPALAALWVAAVASCLLYALWRPTRLALGQRVLLAALHFVPLAAVIALLYRPTWVVLTDAGGNKPVLGVLVDTSASMAAEDCSEGRSRHAAALAEVREWSAKWARDFTVCAAGFDRKLVALPSPDALNSTSPTGAETDLAGAVESALNAQPKPALLLLLSDGIHNAAETDPQTAARQARASGVPVFTRCLGSAVAVRDLGVKLSSSEELAFVRQRVRVLALITQTGFDNMEVGVELRQAGKVLEAKKVRFANGAAEVPAEFTVSQDVPGVYSYEVAVPPQPGEALVSNNYRRFALRVVNERIRILLVEGKPYWDSKFLSRVLNHDPNVLLTTATLLRKDRVIIEPPALGKDAPATETGATTGKEAAAVWVEPRDSNLLLEDQRFLAQYQVLILGRDVEVFLTDQAIESLRDWVARTGGHLLCVRGRPVGETALQPALAALLPVAWKSGAEQRFRVQLTAHGRALALFDPSSAASGLADDPDVILRSLPQLVTATVVDKERALSVVLARAGAETGEPMAVLSVQNYGSGKTVVLEGQGMWHWAFRPPADKLHAEDVFHAFWSNMVRWLAGSNDFLPSQEMALRAGKPLYQSGERPILYVLRREGTPGTHAETTSTGGALMPRLELAREDVNGALDAGFPARQLNAAPMPKETSMFRAELEALPEGRYRARLLEPPADAAATFEVLPPLREKLDLRARPELLQELSALTDAHALKKEELGRLSEFFRDFARVHMAGTDTRLPAWDKAWVLGGFMAWLAALWWLRRRWGAI